MGGAQAASLALPRDGRRNVPQRFPE